MRLQATTLPLASMLLLAVAASVDAANTTACDALQMSTYYAARGTLQTQCDYLLSGFFASCSDECYAHFKSVVAVAPTNCTLPGGTIPRADDEQFVKRCEDARANATSKYTPQTQEGLPNCTVADENEWDLKYGYSSPYDECVVTITTAKTCSDQCMKTLEEGVDAAKVCRLQGGYSSREMKKKDLVGCIQVRGEDVKTNKLVQSLPTSDSTNKSSSDTSSPGARSASSASAATLTLAVGVTSLVVAMFSQ